MIEKWQTGTTRCVAIRVIIYSMQTSLNCYRLEHLNLLIEQARAKGGLIERFGVDETEKSNGYANYFYPNNQHMHLKPRDELLAIQYNPVDVISVPHFWCLLRQ